MNPSSGLPPRSRTVNVLIASRLEPQFQQQIAAVNPDLKLTEVCDLVSAELRLAPSGGLPPEKRQALDECLSSAEVVLAQMPPRDLVRRAPSLRWLHLVSAGADRLAGTGILESGVIVTNSSGIHRDTISEFVLTMMLMLAKGASACFQRQQNRQWKRFVPGELKGKTLGIVGLGRIGQGVARLGITLGMRVVATRRSAVRRESDVTGVDALYPPAQTARDAQRERLRGVAGAAYARDDPAYWRSGVEGHEAHRLPHKRLPGPGGGRTSADPGA